MSRVAHQIKHDLVPCVRNTAVFLVRSNRVVILLELAVEERPRRRDGVMRRSVLSTEDRGKKEYELRAEIVRVGMHVQREVVEHFHRVT